MQPAPGRPRTTETRRQCPSQKRRSTKWRLTKHLARPYDTIEIGEDITESGMPHALDVVQQAHRVEHRSEGGLVRRGRAQSHNAEVLKTDAKLAHLDAGLAAPIAPSSAKDASTQREKERRDALSDARAQDLL